MREHSTQQVQINYNSLNVWPTHARRAAMLATVPRVVGAFESCVSFTGSLAVVHSVCRHSTYVRSLESATPVLRDATSTCPIDQHRCRAGSAASAVQKRNANSVSDAKQAAPARGQGGPQAERVAFEGDTPSAASRHTVAVVRTTVKRREKPADRLIFSQSAAFIFGASEFSLQKTELG